MIRDKQKTNHHLGKSFCDQKLCSKMNKDVIQQIENINENHQDPNSQGNCVKIVCFSGIHNNKSSKN